MSSEPRPQLASALSLRTFAVWGAALFVFLVSSGFKRTAYDAYSLLAATWLQGHLWITSPGPAIDAVGVNGHYYIIEAPLPGVIMLPFVAIFGPRASQEFVCVLCAAIAVAAAHVVLERIGVGGWRRWLLVAFFALGTAIWWCSAFGAVWMFAGVAAAMFVMLALAEWYGHRRPWLVGLLVMGGALCRAPVILSLLPLGAWLWSEGADRKESVRRLLQFAAGVAPLLLAYFAYNDARYGTFADVGYTQWYHQDQVGQPTGSPFRLQYLPFNLYSFFVLAPDFNRMFPWFHLSGFGVSLTFTSPALALALAASWRAKETWALWAAIVLVAAPSLLYYVNGFEQFGMRHSLDFVAFALPLVSRGFARVPLGLSLPLIIYSLLANFLGVWYSWAYHAFTVVPS